MKRARISYDLDDSSQKKCRTEPTLDPYTISRVFEVLMEGHYLCVNDFRSSPFRIVALGLNRGIVFHSVLHPPIIKSSLDQRRQCNEMLHIEVKRFEHWKSERTSQGFSNQTGKAEVFFCKSDCFPTFRKDKRLFPGKKLYSPFVWMKKNFPEAQEISWANGQTWEVLISKSSGNSIMEVYYHLRRSVDEDGKVTLSQAFGRLRWDNLICPLSSFKKFPRGNVSEHKEVMCQ